MALPLDFTFEQSHQDPRALIEELVAHNIGAIPAYVSWIDKEGTTKKEKTVVTGSWTQYQTELIDDYTLNRRFTKGIRDSQHFKPEDPSVIPNGVALLLSAAHGNLGNLDFDFDHERLFPLFWEQLIALYPAIRFKLHLEKTPSAGYHVIFRLPDSIPTPEKGVVYAAKPLPDGKQQVLVETRGFKQALIISPTPGYRREVNNLPLTDLEPLTEEEYAAILRIVRSFDEMPKKEAAPAKTAAKKQRRTFQRGKYSPMSLHDVPEHLRQYDCGDFHLEDEDPEQLGSIALFNRLFPVASYLEDKGWLYKGDDPINGEQYIRPGKTEADERCATLKEVNGILYFFNFSTSVPEIEADKSYTPYGLFCAYEGFDEDGEGLAVIEALGYKGYCKGTKAVQAEGLDLETDNYGQYLSSLNNAVTILTDGADFKEVAKVNDLTNTVVLTRQLDYLQPGEPLDKQCRDVMRVVISKKYGVGFSDQTLQTACSYVYPRNTFNPFLDFVTSGEWDGIDRITTLLEDCFGVKTTAYISAITERWLIAAIARQYQPGLKFDYVLTLISNEGTGKSGLVARLFDPLYLGVNGWNADAMSLKQLCDPKLYVEGVTGKVGVEIAEFAGSKRVEIEELKSALTCRQRTFRGAYKELGRSNPVRQVFCVTTNEVQFLTALTGNRRFWIVNLPSGAFNGKVYTYLTTEVCRQIWAQALAMYQERCTADGRFRPETLLLPPELEKIATQQQEKARCHDPLEDDILEAISAVSRYEIVDKADDVVVVRPIYKLDSAISTKALWEEVYEDKKTITSGDSRKIASIMSHYGWAPTNNVREGAARQRGYVRPDSDSEPFPIAKELFVPRSNPLYETYNPCWQFDNLLVGGTMYPSNMPTGYSVAPVYQDR